MSERHVSRCALRSAAIPFALGLWGAACLSACASEPSASKTDAGHDHDGHVHDHGLDAGYDGDGSPTVIVEGDFAWVLPAGFPKPRVPADNPMSAAKVELGRRLFYDKRLSGNETQSCASCHRQELAFTDGRGQALGSTGESHPRGAMALANVGYATVLGWGNPLLSSLEKQTPVPMFGEAPVELGLAGRESEVLERLRAEPLYPPLFERSFPGEQDAVSVGNVVRAIAAFERTLISGQSPYDRFVYGGDSAALSAEAQRGRALFFSERLECFHCHGGFAFADSVEHEASTFREVAFHNTGLYNVDGKGAYPADNRGVLDITGNPADMGRMKAPSLRNIAVTAPYMHDGSIATLEAVLDHYAAGGRTIASGPNAGEGSKSPLKSEFVTGFTLTTTERSEVIEFLKSLTDERFLHAPQFSDPWTSPPDAGAADAPGD